MENKKHKLSIIPKYDNINYSWGNTWGGMFEDDKKDVVFFGPDNKFPNHLIELSHKSSTHSTALSAKQTAIVGKGLTADKPEYLDRANREGESWNTIFAKCASDLVMFGGFALEIIWSQDRLSIAEVYHIDFTYLRAHKMDHRGNIPGYYVSREFNKRMGGTPPKDQIPYLPTFSRKDRTSPSAVYYYKPYVPGTEYYPLPDYIGGLKVIELDAEVDNFHINNIKHGLAPSIAITTYTDADEEQRDMIEKQLRLAYAGSDNAGSLIYMDVASKDQQPDITPIPQNGADGYYVAVNEMVVQKILTAHKITSPMLLGIKTSGQLGGRQELLDAYLHFLTTVIEPMQQEILDVFTYVFSTNGIDITLGVEQTKLFADGEEKVDVVTGTEAESGEDKQLEIDITQEGLK